LAAPRQTLIALLCALARALGLKRDSMTEQAVGHCAECAAPFAYRLIHNGFNESAYAYCDRCGMTALFDGWYAAIPQAAHLTLHQRISADVEPFLRSCACGGRFTAGAEPRCPTCIRPLDPNDVTDFIESNAPGAKQGWRWQRNWAGLYAIVIDGRVAPDPWLSPLPSRRAKA